jgi:hypothetical protein
LLSEIGTRFNGFGPGMDESWQDEVERRSERFDWHLSLPKSAMRACEIYDAMLDDADEFGQVARLLTLPASAASVAVRRWFLSELIGQLRGSEATSWDESAFHRELTERMAPT